MLRSPAAASVSVTWASLAGKPAAFAPAPHTHAYGDLTGVPASFPPSAHTHAWADVTGKPSAFAPAAHTHLWADITDKPTAFPPATHAHAWADVTGKPTTFPPSTHTHLWADITDRPTIPAATPLGSATPQPLGTAAAGTSANAAREDHVHPLPSGRLQPVGTATVGETLLVSLSLGVKRYTGTMAGLAVGDRIMAFLTGAPGASSLQDIYVSAANTYNVGLLNPALGIGATIAVPIAIYRVT